ncbi:exostosin-2 isoform X2 [Carex littledalei]|uniref:Exostosin-2 isoform X2 n=1 Tax=Carex littledalei TaxID=544730 RepID=A0A833R3K4_9POAL|nr:exostosin-2 isoform X2 [Carex littledalei]
MISSTEAQAVNSTTNDAHLGGFLLFFWLAVARWSEAIKEVKAVIMPGLSRFVVKSFNMSTSKNHTDCEDIAMSFFVANVTGSPSIWVQGKS